VPQVHAYITDQKKHLWEKFLKDNPHKYRSLSDMIERCVDREVWGLESTREVILEAGNSEAILKEIEKLKEILTERDKKRQQIEFAEREILTLSRGKFDEAKARVTELMQHAKKLDVDQVGGILDLAAKVALSCLVQLKEEKRVFLNENMEWIWCD